MELIMGSTTKVRAGWQRPLALIALSAIPVGAGVVRVVELARGAEVTPANARFFAAPLPVVVHIFSVTLFCVLGAFQFAPAFRRQRPRWHRAVGSLLVFCGVAGGLSGLWMTHFYPRVEGDGDALYVMRLLFGSAMIACVILGFLAVRRRDLVQHGAWMTRGYAIALGGGTQALLHLLWLLGPGKPSVAARAVLMGAGWIINLAVAEWIIRRRTVYRGRAPLSSGERSSGERLTA
jgi:uncharacterized membrane protein